MTTALTQVAQAIPAYCSSGHGVLTPAQWKTCWDAGWNLPTGTATSDLASVSPYLTPMVLFIIGLAVLFALSRSRSRRTATN